MGGENKRIMGKKNPGLMKRGGEKVGFGGIGGGARDTE